MENSFIFLAVLVQILLTITIYISLGFAKAKAMKLNEVNLDRRGMHEDAWPESVQKINNNIRSQFEIPILFYMMIFMLWELKAVDIYVQAIAWVFVFSRIVHSYIHTGSNYVPLRRKFFFVGVACIFALIALCFMAVL